MNFLTSKRRPILFIASVANFAAALVALISPAFFFSQFFKYPPDPATTFPYVAMYHYLFWGVVLIMGIAYWMAAVNFEKHRVVLLIGGLGKLLAAAFWGMLFLQDQGKWMMASGAAWDGLLGVIMILMLMGKKEKAE